MRPEGTAVVIDEDVATSRGMVAKKAEVRDTAYYVSSVWRATEIGDFAHGTGIITEEQR
jgi:hypothetical protein